MFFFKFFSKHKPARKKNYHKINPDEFILISEHLINSYSITHQLLGIIMASGIPLTHIKHQNSLQFQI